MNCTMTPSFYKIKKENIIIGLIVVFFIVGTVKNIFAFTTEDCPDRTGYSFVQEDHWSHYENIYVIRGIAYGSFTDGRFTTPNICGVQTGGTLVCTTDVSVGDGTYYICKYPYRAYYGCSTTDYDNAVAKCGGVDRVDWLNSNNNICDIDCKEPDCDAEYKAKIKECGGEQYIKSWDDQSCTGECIVYEDKNKGTDNDCPQPN